MKKLCISLFILLQACTLVLAQKKVAADQKPSQTPKQQEAYKPDNKQNDRPAAKPQPAPSYDYNEKQPADRPANNSRPNRPDADLTKPAKEEAKVNNTAKAPAEEEKAVVAKPPMSTVEEEKENTTTPQPKPTPPPTLQPSPPPTLPSPKPPMTNDDYCNWADNHQYLFPNNVWLSPSYLSCRCNASWYGWWYFNADNNCNWAGDVTIVNTTNQTIMLYTEKHAADEMPTVNNNVGPPISINAVYAPMEILPNDSLTFKMPCGALKYEAQEKNPKTTVAKKSIGWVRTVGYDVRLEIKEEDMQ